MAATTGRRYRFGVFEADSTTGELRRKGVRIRLHAQPFQVLFLLLERPGELLTREEISRELWPDGTFVDFEHGVNSAINRLREALGDKASSPRYVETLARRGYRFVAPVERIAPESVIAAEPLSHITPTPEVLRENATPAVSVPEPEIFGPPPASASTGLLDQILARPGDLPQTSATTVQALFLLLQLMYLGFYVGALANLGEIHELFAPLSLAAQAFALLIVTATVLIPVRIFLVCAAVLHAPRIRDQFLRLWRILLPLDALWSLAPFLLLHHISSGLALACAAPLVYSPFAQRSLILMGAGTPGVRQASPDQPYP